MLSFGLQISFCKLIFTESSGPFVLQRMGLYLQHASVSLQNLLKIGIQINMFPILLMFTQKQISVGKHTQESILWSILELV